jgi:hypothetical protein
MKVSLRAASGVINLTSVYTCEQKTYLSFHYALNYLELYVEKHKVLTYIEHHSVCPLVGIGTPPPL